MNSVTQFILYCNKEYLDYELKLYNFICQTVKLKINILRNIGIVELNFDLLMKNFSAETLIK
jgi:hypothetical protein